MNNKYIIVLLIIIFFTIENLFSQNERFSVSVGIATSQILGENANTLPMVPRDSSKPQITGGSFDAVQPGVAIRFNYFVDKDMRFGIPFGLDYMFYRTAERIPISAKVTAWINHTIEVPTIFTGLNYYFFKFPVANVRAFSGIEFRASLIQQGVFNRKIYYENYDSTQYFQMKTKESAVRYGADWRIGFDGEIYKNLHIFTSVGFGIMNLLKRDNERGELFTPIKGWDTNKESHVVLVNFCLLLQYRF